MNGNTVGVNPLKIIRDAKKLVNAASETDLEISAPVPFETFMEAYYRYRSVRVV